MIERMRSDVLTCIYVVVACLTSWTAPARADESRSYDATVARLERMIRLEVERGTVTGLSIALVDDQRLVWAAGFGLADRRSGRAADADTVYRVGSISKLFTALGVMSLVDEGKLDLDAPITRYDPEYTIGKGRFTDPKPTTLRQLMTHRSGLPRESPVGSYFDDSEPTLEQTVRSLGRCELAHEPETVTRYSNLAVSLEGWILERAAGENFEAFQRRSILDAMGMAASDFRVTDRVRGHLATGYMGLADGREIPAPLFELGTIPAGNLYAPVKDMAKFLSLIFAGGRAGERRIVQPATLRSMFEVQYAGPDQTSGFGLGFAVGRLDERLWIGHGGAVYGFSSQLGALPDERLGAIVCANDDVVNGTTAVVARRALQWMLAERAGEEGPKLPAYVELDNAALATFTGHFKSRDRWLRVFLTPRGLAVENMGQTLELRPVGERRLLAYGGGLYEAPFEYDEERARVTFLGAPHERFDPLTLAAETPAAWRDYLGIYGPDFIPTVIEIRHGRLCALVENAFLYVMEPAEPDEFIFPRGMYEGEKLIFERAPDGIVRSIRFGAMRFRRQNEPPEGDASPGARERSE